MGRDSQRKSSRTEPLSAKQVELLLCGLLRNEFLFREAAEVLSADHFTNYGAVYALVWEAALRCWKSQGRIPFREQLEGEVDRMMAGGIVLDEYQSASLERCVEFFYDPRLDAIDADRWEKAVRGYLRDLMLDVAVDQIRAEVAGPDRPHDPSSLIADFRRHVELALQASTPLPSAPYVEGWRPRGTERRSTGLPFLDEYMNGGDCPGELYGIVGPFKSAKTALGLAISIEGALRVQRSSAEGALGLAYFASYELPADPTVRLRALCYAAEVPMDSIENPGDWDRLSVRGQLKPYERERFAHLLAQGLDPPGERERIDAAMAMLNRNWRILDMRGREGCYPGTGGAPELERIISADLRALQRAGVAAHAEVVVIDYLVLAVEQQLCANQYRPEHMRHLMREFIREAKAMADRLACPIWILQQLNAEENRRAPGSGTRSTGSAEFRSFAEKLAFSFTMGAKTKDNLMVFNCDYQRRASGAREICLQFDPQFQRFVHQQHAVLDPISHRVLSAAELQQLSGSSSASSAKSRSASFRLRDAAL